MKKDFAVSASATENYRLAYPLQPAIPVCASCGKETEETGLHLAWREKRFVLCIDCFCVGFDLLAMSISEKHGARKCDSAAQEDG